MRIRKLAERAGVTVDTIRFYEKKGLLDETHFERGDNGYRAYGDSAVERLEMIKQAQTAGFSLTEIGELFGLWAIDALTDEVIAERLREKLRQVDAKIAELAQIQGYLLHKLQQLEQGTYAGQQATGNRQQRA